MGYPGIILKMGGSKAYLGLVVVSWLVRVLVLTAGYFYFGSFIRAILFYLAFQVVGACGCRWIECINERILLRYSRRNRH
jgi:hypothetical protein